MNISKAYIVAFFIISQHSQHVLGFGCSKDRHSSLTTDIIICQPSCRNEKAIIKSGGRNEIIESSSETRRNVLKKLGLFISSIPVGIQPGMARADDDSTLPNIGMKKSSPKKPFAPASALLPAARVKYTVEESIRLLEELETFGTDKKPLDDVIMDLNKLIGVNSYMSPLSGNESKKNKAAPIDEELMKPSKAKLYQETYNDKLKDISPIDVPYALLTKAGDYRQFDQLQKRQRKLEKLNPIREAFNYYTRQLQFDTEYYVLNASAEDKKKMIRNDALPDIKSVIVSDLDLRDLIRNQVLDAYDDVKFGLEYQVNNYKTGKSDFDGNELKATLMRAKNEIDRWFSFIDSSDVNAAMETVGNE
ncbi:hypothetical protein CTEN210_13848 [Chaetoceros tenuissimus]|uniref:Uncharacterized protein n=1 Tax=Chaetoceros tenuissimus TaxID=426638 RepID=A0AAD3D3S9_9STRA|nr:hypothetical protein CTEN210_13848 [Chaetoceros tenuissimus]